MINSTRNLPNFHKERPSSASKNDSSSKSFFAQTKSPKSLNDSGINFKKVDNTKYFLLYYFRYNILVKASIIIQI